MAPNDPRDGALSPGARVGPYEVTGRVGAGGMGEVYRARDARFGRDVAIKVLPVSFASDPERLRRFEQEARAAGTIDHPGILVVHDFGFHEGRPFLATELLEGESLRERLAAGALPARKAADLAIQVARGLAAAHEKGIVHRDLKPDNVFLTRDGRAKILDFGLAKLTAPSPLEIDREAATEASPGTSPGVLIGTMGYLSPEQARGRPADARSDIFSLGLVLYEMLTGTRAFARDSSVETLNAILKEDVPDMKTASGPAPAPLERLVRRCLEKDPAERFQTARDLAFALEALTGGSASDTTPALSVEVDTHGDRKWSGFTRPLAAAVLTALVVAGAAWLTRPAPPLRVTASRTLATYQRAAIYGLQGTSDGEHVFYVAPRGERAAVYQISASGGDPVEIPHPFAGTVFVFGWVPAESALLVAGSREIFTPSDADEGWPLWKLPVPRGAPQRVGNLLASSADVSPDARSLALTRGRSVFVASLDGSGEHEIHHAQGTTSSVRWAPDGASLRFTAPRAQEGQEPWIWEVAPRGGPPRALWPGSKGIWARDSRRFVFTGPQTGDVYLADESWTSRLRGRLRPITSGPLSYTVLGLSGDGRRIFVSTRARGPSARGTLMRFDPRSKRFEPALGGESAIYAEPSPDGQWLAWVRYPDGTLWKSRPDGSERLQLTTPPRAAHLPRWSPDGKRLVFASLPNPWQPDGEIRTVAADGSETETIARPPAPGQGYWDACWLTDGSIVLSQMLGSGPRGLLRLDPRTRELAPISGTASLLYPKCSRQGDLLAAAFGQGQTLWKLRRHGSNEWVDLGAFAHVYPHFTRDGRSVCALAVVGMRIECLSLETRRLSLFAETSPLELARWVIVPWMGLDADDRPFVTAASGRTETLYALEWEAP